MGLSETAAKITLLFWIIGSLPWSRRYVRIECPNLGGRTKRLRLEFSKAFQEMTLYTRKRSGFTNFRCQNCNLIRVYFLLTLVAFVESTVVDPEDQGDIAVVRLSRWLIKCLLAHLRNFWNHTDECINSNYRKTGVNVNLVPSTKFT